MIIFALYRKNCWFKLDMRVVLGLWPCYIFGGLWLRVKIIGSLNTLYFLYTLVRMIATNAGVTHSGIVLAYAPVHAKMPLNISPIPRILVDSAIF